MTREEHDILITKYGISYITNRSANLLSLLVTKREEHNKTETLILELKDIRFKANLPSSEAFRRAVLELVEKKLIKGYENTKRSAFGTFIFFEEGNTLKNALNYKQNKENAEKEAI